MKEKEGKTYAVTIKNNNKTTHKTPKKKKKERKKVQLPDY